MSHSVVLEKFYGMEAYADTPNAPSPAPSAPAPAVIAPAGPQTPPATAPAPAVPQTQKAPATATAPATAPATPSTTVIVMPSVPAPPTTEEKESFWDSTLFITLISIIGCIVLFLVIFFLFKAFYRPQIGGKMKMRVRRA